MSATRVHPTVRNCRTEQRQDHTPFSQHTTGVTTQRQASERRQRFGRSLDRDFNFGHYARVSFPHVAFLVVAAAFVCFSVATAWRYGGQVDRAKRVWTRAWLILVCALAAGPAGWLVPFGAIYIGLRYHNVWRHAPRASAALPALSSRLTP